MPALRRACATLIGDRLLPGQTARDSVDLDSYNPVAVRASSVMVAPAGAFPGRQ